MLKATAMSLNYTDIDWNTATDFIQDNQSLVWILVGSIIVISLCFGLLANQPIPKINVPVPVQAQQGWTGEVFSKPSIQGRDPSIIQCYCPATGQLLDTVNAATRVDVDIAIEKAKAAQLKWRNTTFKQRTLVLQTLLKFILDNQGTGPT
jgi:delta 1-pyrroline-5-carboxylate dehydrogenase